MKNIYDKFFEPKFFLTVLVITCSAVLAGLGRIKGDDFEAIAVIALGVYAGVSRKKKGDPPSF